MASGTEARTPLSRERVLRAAVSLADEHGIEALTMRRLAEEVGAEAMSLYYHVPNKDSVLDGVVEVVLGEIIEVVDALDQAATGPAWKAAMRRRVLSAREVMMRHRWAPQVIQTRTNASFSVLRYLDGVVGLMRAGGFTNDQCHHAMHALGSRALGFTQELFTPDDGTSAADAGDSLAAMAEHVPNLVGMLADVAHDDPDAILGWCDDQSEFEFGLDIILDGLDRLRP